MADKTKTIYNRSPMNFRINDEVLKTGEFAEVDYELANKLLKAYPDKLSDPNNNKKKVIKKIDARIKEIESEIADKK